MSGPTQIDGKEIANWADTSANAEHVLHQLVRRLLWASARLRSLDMSAGTAINLDGWDGICNALEASVHCPSGISGWELSKRKDVAVKLDEDYEKRSKNPAPLVAANSSYVAVTARRYAKKQDWIAERNAKGIWANVRVLDADDLAQWLEECPAVATWFASSQLNRPSYELSSVERFLADWSAETGSQLALPPRLLLLAREEQREQVLQWSMQLRPSPLVIQASSKREAQLFAAATFDALDDVPREEKLARSLVVETADAWRRMIREQTKQPLFLIPTFPDFELELGQGQHFVVVPQDRQIALTTSGVTIHEPLPWRTLVPVLVELGLPQRKAHQLAERSRGQLRALQLQLGATETKPPAWLTRESHAELIAMLLLGAWEPGHSGDGGAARQLGVAPDALERLCARLTSVEGAPVQRDGAAYRWSYDMWAKFAPELSKRTLERFRDLASRILADDDPMYLRPANERYFAAVLGDRPEYSATLRAAVASSVLELAHNDNLLRSLGPSIGTRTVEAIVYAALEPWWVRWASLGRQLLLLAEAAPRVFLARLASSLGCGDGIAQMFEEEGMPALHGSTPHTPVLWALELLCWDQETMPLAAEQLMQLAERDPADRRSVPRVANRPLPSLAAVFHTVTPQTLCNDDQRFEILGRLVARHPEQGFDLLLRLLRQLSGGILPQAPAPKHDERVPATPLMPTEAVALTRGRRAFELALDTAGQKPERWVRLIDSPINQLLGDDSNQAMLDRLLALRQDFDDLSCLSICDAARRVLHRLYATSLHKTRDVRRRQLHQILQAFEPGDLILGCAWMFEPGSSLLEPHATLRGSETDAKRDENRDAALVRLLAGGDRLGTVSKLVTFLLDRSVDLRDLGRALARSDYASEFDTLLLRNTPGDGLRPLAAPLPWVDTVHSDPGSTGWHN